MCPASDLLDLALLIGGPGTWLLGWSRFTFPGLGTRSQWTSGGTSRVRSGLIEMTLDHDTGEMEGSCLPVLSPGSNSGHWMRLLRDLVTECQTGDPDGVRLLEAYLDHRFPYWRDDTQNEEQRREAAQPTSGVMSPEEAYRILDLQLGATPDQSRQAHHALMKKLHPDQGGSTYLAARVNQAKDLLLSRHER